MCTRQLQRCVNKAATNLEPALAVVTAHEASAQVTEQTEVKHPGSDVDRDNLRVVEIEERLHQRVKTLVDAFFSREYQRQQRGAPERARARQRRQLARARDQWLYVGQCRAIDDDLAVDADSVEYGDRRSAGGDEAAAVSYIEPATPSGQLGERSEFTPTSWSCEPASARAMAAHRRPAARSTSRFSGP